ncbi:MAG: cold-shock protein [Planctomycetes bacterium]|nr:cold-shock protein [Planctomycetota bacterium]
MSKGTVNQFDDVEGVGSITPDDGGKDIYVHWSHIETDSNIQSLVVGQKVEYEPITDVVFPFASSVHMI